MNKKHTSSIDLIKPEQLKHILTTAVTFILINLFIIRKSALPIIVFQKSVFYEWMKMNYKTTLLDIFKINDM